MNQIRVNNQYLDLLPDTNIVIDKHSKLFDDLEVTQTDFSYNFEFPKTAKNMDILGNPSPDNASKTIYNNLPCDILGNDGLPIYTGKLKVETINNRKITASFFSGNYNWLALLDAPLSDLDFSEYDTDITEANIITSRVVNDGLVFQLLDLGGLITRSTTDLKVEDFTGSIYVKSIFRKIFNRNGLKFTGDLVNDWLFNNTVICKNNKNQLEIEASSCFAEKTSTTTRPTENVDYKVTFQNDSVFPYFDGENDCFDLANSKYVAPYKMTVLVECTLQASTTDANYSNRIRLYINGAFTFVDTGLAIGGLYNTAAPGDQEFFTITRTIDLEAGDELEIYSHWQESTGSVTPISILTGKLKITPVFIYRVFGSTMIPNWTQKDFVLSYLNLFNVISDFDPISKTVTFNLFEKLTSKTPLDISQYVDPSTIETDFSDFVSGFGKNNYLSYKEGSDEDLKKEYNVKEFIKYGAGVIEVDNDFIGDSKDIIQSGFTSPIGYYNKVFTASLERLNFVELEEVSSTDFASVSSSSGIARFAVSHNYFNIGDLVRIEGSSFPDYNGDWIITVVGSGYIEIDCPFFVTATGNVSKLNHRYTDNDDVFLLVNTRDQDVAWISGAASFDLEGTAYTSFAYGYFNLLSVGDTVNSSYKQGLSFGEVVHPLHYQWSLIDTYWQSVDNVLNDPVKITADFRFPNQVFRQLSPLVPVHLKTKETSNMYYLQQIRGYKSSYQPCEVELIKI